MSSSDQIRLFVAILLPQEVVACLMSVQKRLEQFRTNVCFSREDKLHITVKFIGEISQDLVQATAGILKEVGLRHRSFDLEIRDWGAFPNRSRPRVLWVGGGVGSDYLIALANDVDKSLSARGITKPERFSPHITLGRVRRPDASGVLSQALRQKIGMIGILHASEMNLIKSTLSTNGSRYEVLDVITLGRPADKLSPVGSL